MPINRQDTEYLNKWSRAHKSLLDQKAIAYQHYKLNSSEIVWLLTDKNKTDSILKKLMTMTQMTFKGKPDYIQGVKDIASTTSAMIQQLDTKFWLLRSENLKETLERHTELMNTWLEERDNPELKELVIRKIGLNKNTAQRMSKCLVNKYMEKSERSETTTLVPKNLQFLDLAEPSGELMMPSYSTFRAPQNEPHGINDTSKHKNPHNGKAGTSKKRKAQTEENFENQPKKQSLSNLSTEHQPAAYPKQMSGTQINKAPENPTPTIKPATYTPDKTEGNLHTNYLVKSVEKLRKIAPNRPNPRNVRELLLEVASQKKKNQTHSQRTQKDHINNELMGKPKNENEYTRTSSKPTETQISLTEALQIVGETETNRKSEQTANNKGEESRKNVK